jgi:hypothetical protein
MNGWKPCHARRVDCGYRQLDQAHLRQRGQQLGEIDPKIFASERALDGDFPNASRAVINFVVVSSKSSRASRGNRSLRAAAQSSKRVSSKSLTVSGLRKRE